MLWSCPDRAHRPIVPGVNFTFEDASSSAASDREIQSDGSFDICQSASLAGASAVSAFDDAPAAVPVGPSSELELELELELDPESDGARFDLEEPPELSFRAQPLPLKWTAGATMAFFIGPPHTLHTEGPWPWTECMTSTSWPQLVQT
jgi:hypothetical protein